uniref:Uncharacterized protein n=1 Tax=Anguilla anguilla TaxID=7936 RepID=A0A0E9P5E4_ANGAN
MLQSASRLLLPCVVLYVSQYQSIR